MTSPVNPVVANLYKEFFLTQSSNISSEPFWRRYVDDTFDILQQSQKEKFPQHINSVDPFILFTTEEAK